MTCFKGKSACENDRYQKMLQEKRSEYPSIKYNFGSWNSRSPSQRESMCVSLGRDVEVLRLKKSGRIDDVALSDGYRVDERAAKVYTLLYSEYNKVYKQRQCDQILNSAVVNQDSVQVEKTAKELQGRVEKDVQEQRTIIIAVGGIVLLLGTTLILRKL